MLSHVFIGVTDFDRAYNFYAALFQALGLPQRFLRRGKTMGRLERRRRCAAVVCDWSSV